MFGFAHILLLLLSGKIVALKAFHCKVINDHKALEKEGAAYITIPLFKKVDATIVQRNYEQIKHDVQVNIKIVDVFHPVAQRGLAKLVC